MLYDLHLSMLANYGLSLWDVLTLVVGVIMIVVFLVHRKCQKNRRKEFEKSMDEKIQAIKNEQSTTASQVDA